MAERPSVRNSNSDEGAAAAAAALAVPGRRAEWADVGRVPSNQSTMANEISSTSYTSVAAGGMMGKNPCSPYAAAGGTVT